MPTKIPTHRDGAKALSSYTDILSTHLPTTPEVLTDRFEYDSMTLGQLEGIIRKNLPAFIETGYALRAIRDRGLFRPKFTRFEDYCRSVWGFCRQTGHNAIKGAQIATELSSIGDKAIVVNESQIRPLAKLRSRELRVEAFLLAVSQCATKCPTAAQVSMAVKDIQMRERLKDSVPTNTNASSKFGDEVRIIRGDTADGGLLSPGSVHVVIGSPPYNIGATYPTGDDFLPLPDYLKKIRAWLENCFDWLIPEGGRLALNVPLDTRKSGPYPFAGEITRIAQEVGFAYEATIIWDEASHRGRWVHVDPIASPLIFCRCEAIILFSKGGLKRRTPTSIPDITRQEVEEWSCGYWRFAGSHKNNQHPCPFPAELPRRLIKLLSYPTDVILDPWAGTGTTLLEAMQLKRRAVGIEIEESYCNLIKKRISSASSPSASQPE